MVLLVSCSVARNDSFTCSCGVETARNASEKRANARECGALSRSRRHRLDQERIDAPLALLSLSLSLPRSLPRSHAPALLLPALRQPLWREVPWARGLLHRTFGRRERRGEMLLAAARCFLLSLTFRQPSAALSRDSIDPLAVSSLSLPLRLGDAAALSPALNPSLFLILACNEIAILFYLLTTFLSFKLENPCLLKTISLSGRPRRVDPRLPRRRHAPLAGLRLRQL